jgi:hypothetical protein
LAPHGQPICAGRLLALADGQVTIEIADRRAPELRVFPTLAIAHHGDYEAYLFMTRVLRFERARGDNPATLTVAVPGSASRVGADPRKLTRRSVRVPLLDDSGLRVYVDHHSGRWPAHAHDISLGGILLELPKTGPSLEDGDRVSVVLFRGGEEIALTGEVRHTDGKKAGLLFFELGRASLVQPPASYRKLVSELERQWLRRRRS